MDFNNTHVFPKEALSVTTNPPTNNTGTPVTPISFLALQTTRDVYPTSRFQFTSGFIRAAKNEI